MQLIFMPTAKTNLQIKILGPMKTFPKLTMVFALLLFFILENKAQCPPASSSYIHVVQKGETLYRISKKYYMTVDELAKLNKINAFDNLAICQELIISDAYFSQNGRPAETGGTGSPEAEARPQGGKRHTVRKGESIAGIAHAYGYTEERFRRFNGLGPNERALPDMVLKTSDCDCENSGGWTDPVTDRPSTETRPPEREREEWEYDPPSRTGGSSRPGGSFEEDPFGEEGSGGYGWRPSGSSPDPYEERIDRKPTRPTTSEPARRPSASSRNNDQKYIPADERLANQKSNGTKTSGGGSGITKDAARYMTAEEISMLKEINLVRSNPAGYVKYVEEYKKKIEAGRAFGSVATCDELIKELERTPKLSTLQATECIYRAAKKHGQDQRPTGDVDHIGTDGSYPWDRVRQECPNMTDGNENLVAGPSAVRDCILILLVDDGIPNRGHRRTLLNPDWKYAACYKVGKVGNMPNNWVQNFGK